MSRKANGYRRGTYRGAFLWRWVVGGKVARGEVMARTADVGCSRRIAALEAGWSLVLLDVETGAAGYISLSRGQTDSGIDPRREKRSCMSVASTRAGPGKRTASQCSSQAVARQVTQTAFSVVVLQDNYSGRPL